MFLVEAGKLYRIGELAKLAGVNKSVIDHYTRLGLIEPVGRTDGSYRLYANDTLTKIEFIKKCQHKRMSLAEIQHAIEAEKPTQCAEVGLCMANASLAVEEAWRELAGLDVALARLQGADAAAVKEQAGMVMAKILAMSELLRTILQQI